MCLSDETLKAVGSFYPGQEVSVVKNSKDKEVLDACNCWQSTLCRAVILFQGTPDASFFSKPTCLCRLAQFTLDAYSTMVSAHGERSLFISAMMTMLTFVNGVCKFVFF